MRVFGAIVASVGLSYSCLAYQNYSIIRQQDNIPLNQRRETPKEKIMHREYAEIQRTRHYIFREENSSDPRNKFKLIR
jgi:hypothetical protein